MTETLHLSAIDQLTESHKSVWVDSARIAFFEVDKPKVAKRNWVEVLRWDLEELSPLDPMLWHIVPLVNKRNSQKISLMCCPLEQMDGWQAMITDTEVAELVPDIFGLPENEDGWSIWVDVDKCLVRTGYASGFVMHKLVLQQLLQKLDAMPKSVMGLDPIADKETIEKIENSRLTAPSHIKIYCNGAIDLNLALNTITVESEQSDDLWNVKPQATFNLLKGAYKQKINIRKQLNRWMQVVNPLYLLVFWLLLLTLTWLNIQNNQLQDNIDRYQMNLRSSFGEFLQFPYDPRLNLYQNMTAVSQQLQALTNLQQFSVLKHLSNFNDLFERCGSQCRILQIEGDLNRIAILVQAKNPDMRLMFQKTNQFMQDGFSIQWSEVYPVADELSTATMTVQKLEPLAIND